MKRILITGGPTNEAIDEVMTITNMSTGSLSCDFAKTALDCGCCVTMVFHKSVLRSTRYSAYGLGENPNARTVSVDSCQDMFDALREEAESGLHYDVVIHSAAVGDYKSDFSFRMEDMSEELTDAIINAGCLSRDELAALILKTMTAPSCKVNSETKISSYEPNLTVKLTLTTKIIANLRKWFPDAYLVGSKLLENVTKEHLIEVAVKLANKNDMDVIMANDLAMLRSGQLVRYYCSKQGFTGIELIQDEMMDYAAANWFSEDPVPEYRKKYELWKNNSFFDEETRNELAAITDEKEIEERFYKDLEFGTGGLRGILGAGSNRMNKYNVRKATAGYGQFLLDKYGSSAKEKGVAVGYDCRHFSREFAKELALTMNAMGIPAFVHKTLSATPLLSFTIRELGCVGGVEITASHNPKNYNGYKAYDASGCQLGIEDADAVIARVNATDITSTVVMDEAEAVRRGLLKEVPDEVTEKYLAAVQEQAHETDAKAKAELKIVYTPLHGCGNHPVREVLKRQGFRNVSVVEAQCVADGSFPTVISPNPEEKTALTMAIEQAKAEGAELVLATDPDSDRIGIAVWDGSDFRLFSGNQTGAMLVDYVLTRRADRITDKTRLITTIVTSEFGPAAARAHGVETELVLTGFKHICGKMGKWEESGEAEAFMGYEESYGYLIGSYTRDKDGVLASMLIAEMAAYYKALGLNLSQVLDGLYEKLGYYLDVQTSYYFEGKEGAAKIRSINAGLRKQGKDLLPGVVFMKDYAPGIDGLPPTDCLKYFFEDGSWMAIRPSGTEPKIKLYYCIHAESKDAAQSRLEGIKSKMDAFVNS